MDIGISTLPSCGTPDTIDKLPELPVAEEKRLRRAAHVLQQRLVLRQWLSTHRLQHAYSKLLSLDVSSIEDVYWLEDSTARHVLDPKDFNAWSAARQSLPTGKDTLLALKADLWNTVVKSSRHQDAWTWGGMLVVSVSVCGLVTLAAMTQPSLAPEAKHSLLQYVTGKYLHPGSCKVEWGWEEPVAVGETMCFTVVCFQRNGQPYPVCDTDGLCVAISHGNRKLVKQIAAVTELGSGDPALAHTARVKFTVRTAGIYLVSITIGGVGIAGSPFRKWFSAGRVEARRSRVGRAHAALVLCAQRQRHVYLHPRDQYDNPAPLHEPTAPGFSIEINTLGEPIDPELSNSVKFAYDNVNQRVTMTLCFPTPGVYHATVNYEGNLLHDGQFECIVLTASDMATVQRNVSSKRHYICYEARLLAPSGKPRRVLCCLSPRQLTVKDYILKIIPKRITAFRLCPSTKLVLAPRSAGGAPGGEFTVEDGVQPPLRLAAPERDLLAATFTRLLLANCGGEDTFKNKQEFFYSELRKAHARHAHDKIALRVLRSELVASSLKATRHFSVADWCKNFDVSFQGEQGVDWGGVRREWFSLLCAQLFDAKSALFVSFNDSAAGLVHPNPATQRPPHLKLKHFELAGKLFGKCLYESALGGSHRQLVLWRLTRSFLAQIMDCSVVVELFQLKHFELAGKLFGKCLYESALGGSHRQLVLWRLTRSFLAQIMDCSVVVELFQLKHFELAGKLFGKCLYESALGGSHRQLVLWRLTRSFLAQIMDCSVVVELFQLKHFELAGKLFGKCLYESALGGSHRQLVLWRLTRSFLAQIMDCSVVVELFQLKHFELAGKLFGKCLYESALGGSHRQLVLWRLTRSFLAQIMDCSVVVELFQLKHFELAGKLFGKCLYESALGGSHRQLVLWRLTRSFLAQIMDCSVVVELFQLKHFELAGKLFGKCLYESALGGSHRQLVLWRLTRSFLAQIMDCSVVVELFQLKHFELAGKLFGKCLYESALGGSHRQLVLWRLTRSFLAQIMDCSVVVELFQLKHFELAGKLFGKCLYESALGGSHRQLVLWRLTRSFLAQIMDCSVVVELFQLKHFELAGKLFGKCLYESALGGSHRQLVLWRLTRSFLAQIMDCSVVVELFQLKHFELAGKLFGKCLYESALGGSHRQLVRARLTRSFLAQIMDCSVVVELFQLKHFELAGKLFGKCLYESALGGSHRQLVLWRLTRSFLAQIMDCSVVVELFQLKHFELAGKLFGKCLYESALGGSHRQLVLWRLTRSFLAQIMDCSVVVELFQLKHFELAGKLFGKCLYESALGGSHRQLVRARLTRSFLAQIIGLRVHYKYFEQDDPELFLSKIKYVLETDLEAADCLMELSFSDDVYSNSGRLLHTHELMPAGVSMRVNNKNKIQYLDALAQWRLATRCRLEIEAFLRGLALLVPENLLAIFDENELELLACGTGEVCVSDWRAHAGAGGAGREWERLLGWLWAALDSFTNEERARLLQFTTGCSQLPPGGFQELNPRFQITPAASFGALPTAHTCFNQLCLPDYESYEQLVRALLWAINEGGEGFHMI